MLRIIEIALERLGGIIEPMGPAVGVVVVAGLVGSGYMGYREIEHEKECKADILKLDKAHDTAPALLLSWVHGLRANKCDSPILQVALDRLDRDLSMRVSDPANPAPLDWLRDLDIAAASTIFPTFGKHLAAEDWRVRGGVGSGDADACAAASDLNSNEDETGEPRFHFGSFELDQRFFTLSEERSLAGALQLSGDVTKASGRTAPIVSGVKARFICRPPGIHHPLPHERGRAPAPPKPRPTSRRKETGEAQVRPYPNATYLALRATPDASADNVIGRVLRGGKITVLNIVTLPSGGTWLNVACESEAVQCLDSHSTQHLVAANQTNWFERPETE